jgi:hypothetical protein
MYIREIGLEGLDWIHWLRIGIGFISREHGNESSSSIK